MTRLIDADELIKVLRNSHESHANNSREESLLARDIRLVEEQAKYHPVIPEEMKPLIAKTIEILPQLTDAIVENLPRILDDIDICQECEYRKTSFKEADKDEH